MRSLLVAAALVLAAVPASSQVVRVSVSTAGAEANGPSGPPAISGTGRYVVFASTATNFVAGDTNGVSDIFLRDRDADADGVFDEAGAVSTTRLEAVLRSTASIDRQVISWGSVRAMADSPRSPMRGSRSSPTTVRSSSTCGRPSSMRTPPRGRASSCAKYPPTAPSAWPATR